MTTARAVLVGLLVGLVIVGIGVVTHPHPDRVLIIRAMIDWLGGEVAR